MDACRTGCSSSTRFFRRSRKLSPGAMEATSDCSDRDVQDGTDFLVSPAIEIFHHDDGAVISTEFVQGSLDNSLSLGTLQGKSGIGFGGKVDVSSVRITGMLAFP